MNIQLIVFVSELKLGFLYIHPAPFLCDSFILIFLAQHLWFFRAFKVFLGRTSRQEEAVPVGANTWTYCHPTCQFRRCKRSLGQEDPLEMEMATHSSILAWEILRTEEPGRLQSLVSKRVRYDWATEHAHTHCHHNCHHMIIYVLKDDQECVSTCLGWLS